MPAGLSNNRRPRPRGTPVMPRALTSLLMGTLLSLFVLHRVTPLTGAEPSFLIGKHVEWKYFAGRERPPKEWKQPSFDDSGWKSGRAGFGYGDGDDRTVLKAMQDRYRSVYIRRAFKLANLNDVQALYLHVNFDDSFIAYLNGVRVAIASLTPSNGGLRVHHHEANGHEEFVIENAGRILKPGRNVLAIEGHNVGIDSSDFSLDPILSTRKLKSLIGVDEYLADLDEFEQRLLDQSSYLSRRGFDYATALKELRDSINEDTTMADFVPGLQKLLMQIGDCHAGVSSKAWPTRGGYLPLRPADTEEGLVALSLHQDEPLESECPYLDSIDGVPIERWIAAAARYVPQGSPQLVRRRSLSWIGRVNVIRAELGLPAKEIVVVGLRSADGKKQVEDRLRLTGQGYGVAKVRLGKPRMLDGNVGYLRIPAMDKRLVESTVEHIKQFRDTAGLIIDVRDNGGGTYHLLRAIYGFFVPEDAEPYVTNIAAYRLSHRFSENHIAYRPTYRADWDGWSNEERIAIKRAADVFRPEWLPPEGKFSEWHYMVLGRQPDASDYFFYDKPVVVLCNAGSFSATDGFLSAFSALPQVTLVGESSGGGSGATRRFTLSNTGITVALSSMASFHANGKTFDGNGIEVGVPCKPTLEGFTKGTDSVLQLGVGLLKQKGK
jgi:peptidase S41-like protein